jgi:hypothetical protein
MPFGDQRIEKLCDKYGVSYVPRLVVFRASDGHIIDQNGV